MFVNLPTGASKSMIYLALPTVFDIIREQRGHIIAVVSPLINLKLRSLGISSVSLCSIKEGEISSVEQGKYEAVFGTPESWLNNERWRRMLTSSTYQSKLCGIAVNEAHVIKQW